MTTIEDRLRAATWAAADTVTPDSAPPLRLPDPRGRLHGLRRGWLRPTAPLAAATAVVAVIAASLVVTGGLHTFLAPTRGRHAAGHPTAGRAARAALASVPPYFVTLTGYMGEKRQAVVRATTTGARLATVAAPAPYNTFTFVTAAADDRTFVLAAQQWWNIAPGAAGAQAETRDDSSPTKFFVVRLDPTGHVASLAALPIPVEPGSAWIDGIALSPDGRELAVADDRNAGGNPKIQLFTLATGSQRQWEWPGPGVIGNSKPMGSPLSWIADGRTLAFQLYPANGIIDVRLLDTAAPGPSLRSSTLAVEWARGGVTGAHGLVIRGTGVDPANSLRGFNTLITPDGSAVVAVTYGRQGPLGVTEFSAGTARIEQSRDPQAEDVLWTSPTGSTVIVATPAADDVLTGSQLTPIPGTSRDNNLSAVW